MLGLAVAKPRVRPEPRTEASALIATPVVAPKQDVHKMREDMVARALRGTLVGETIGSVCWRANNR